MYFIRVYQANFFSRAAHAERGGRRSVAGTARGEEKKRAVEALTNQGWVVGFKFFQHLRRYDIYPIRAALRGGGIYFSTCGDMIFIFRKVIKKQYFIAFIEVLQPLLFVLDVCYF